MKKVPKPVAKGKKDSLSIDPETHQQISIEKAHTGLQMWELVRLAWHAYKRPEDTVKFVNCPDCGSTAYAGCAHVVLQFDGKNLLTSSVKIDKLSPLEKFEVAWKLAVERNDASSQLILKSALKIIEGVAHAHRGDSH